jgi:MarR family transcriptional regulator, negative regulator of the multidrug operon emrRAB
MGAVCIAEVKKGGEAAAAMVAIGTFLSGATIEELSLALGLTHSTTVRLVDDLERRGEVAREPGRDRRSVSIVPTDQGRRLSARILAARERVMSEILAPLTDAERVQLEGLLAKLLESQICGGAAPGNVCRLCDAEGCGHYEGRCPVTEAARELRGDGASAADDAADA